MSTTLKILFIFYTSSVFIWENQVFPWFPLISLSFYLLQQFSPCCFVLRQIRNLSLKLWFGFRPVLFRFYFSVKSLPYLLTCTFPFFITTMIHWFISGIACTNLNFGRIYFIFPNLHIEDIVFPMPDFFLKSIFSFLMAV